MSYGSAGGAGLCTGGATLLQQLRDISIKAI